jgi:hypothetical protein
VVKLAIPSNANSNQASTTAVLEEVINAIISHLSFTFPINIVALFNYLAPVDNAKRTGSNYYSFAYLSPRSNQKHTTNIKKPQHFPLLYARVTDLLKYPHQAIHEVKNLPQISQFIKLTIPSLNTMHEQIKFIIDGIGSRTILGPKEYDNADTLQHLGYLIFISLCKC